jgi:phosphoribosylaminoimidazole-succinocarboxamide synthase
MNTLLETNFNFPDQKSFYKGKVRDVYTLKSGLIIMIATDRISAFDHVLPEGIPYKGQVLNQLASRFLDLTSDIIPNWKIASPDPNVTIGKACTPYPIEMVIRGYLTGHAWRTYKNGGRELCGVSLPEGLKEHDRLPEPIITPATKAEEGHDEDISKEEILAQGIVSESEYVQLEAATRALFERGTEIARKEGLILVDTKYEFGTHEGDIHLIDEIHTPDSSRYFYADGYEERQQRGEQQRQLSKEFVREWLIEQGFMGREGDAMPHMPQEFVSLVSKRYIELFEKVTGTPFVKSPSSNLQDRIEDNVRTFLGEYDG